MRKRRNFDPHRLGLTLALIGLAGWVLPSDFALSRPTPSRLALREFNSIRRAYPGSAFDSIRTTSDCPRPLNVWTSNGPEGRIQSLAIDPNDPNTFYAGSETGVSRSTNGGGSWSISSDGLPGYRVRELAIDPIDPTTIYAAIPGLEDDSGLFKSNDGGASWSLTSAPGSSIDTVAIASSNPKIIYVGTSDNYRIDTSVSTDGGETWEVREGPNWIWGDSVWSLAVDPQDSNVLYSYVAGDTFNGPSKSTDGGRSWSGLLGNVVYYVGRFVIDPNNSNTVYLLTAGGIYKSLDGGEFWTNLGLRYSSALAISSNNSNILYAGSGDGVFKSLDGGASWKAFNDGINLDQPFNINALAIDASGMHLYAGTDAGAFDYHYGDACADSLAPVTQNFEASGGIGSVGVTAAGECSWTATSVVNWISINSGSGVTSGSGTVSYSVEPNTGTLPRAGTLVIAARAFTITQAGLPVRIISASVSGRKLFVYGENFDAGAAILLNGEEQRTKNNSQNPKTTLVGKKAGKNIKPDDKLQVRNPNGALSQEFTFTDE
jgi:Putative binding domain, N-terminal